MAIVRLNKENLADEHICCAIADKKNQPGVDLKKAWLALRFAEGMRFNKLDERGKVFIEYIPAEFAWRPVIANGYMLIHCLWVSGKFKNQGYAKALLQTCLDDAASMNGVAMVTSKETFLTDKKFFKLQGFQQCDEAPPYFELMVKKNDAQAADPHFSETAKSLHIEQNKGLYFLYSDQCPFLNYYIAEMASIAIERNIPTKKHKLLSAVEVRELCSAYGTFNVYYNGSFLTHKPVTAKHMAALLDAADNKTQDRNQHER